jgi:hypothetical protein
VVRRIDTPREAAACHLLYLPEASGERLEEILAAVRGRAVLTIGESEGMCRRGFLIAFYWDGPKLRFAVNARAVERSPVDLQAKLLRLAKIVGGEDR